MASSNYDFNVNDNVNGNFVRNVLFFTEAGISKVRVGVVNAAPLKKGK